MLLSPLNTFSRWKRVFQFLLKELFQDWNSLIIYNKKGFQMKEFRDYLQENSCPEKPVNTQFFIVYQKHSPTFDIHLQLPLEHWHFNRAASRLDTPKHYKTQNRRSWICWGTKIESVASNNKTKQLLFNCFTPTNVILSFLVFQGIQ